MQWHMRLFRSSIGFPSVALDTGQHTVFPGGCSSLSPRQNVVYGQFFAHWLSGAVLTLKPVTLSNPLAEERPPSLLKNGVDLRCSGSRQDFRHPRFCRENRNSSRVPLQENTLRPRQWGPESQAIHLEVIATKQESAFLARHSNHRPFLAKFKPLICCFSLADALWQQWLASGFWQQQC